MGFTIRSGPWDLETVRAFLADAVIPIRLASAGTDPMVQSLWFLPADDGLWCATQADSVLVRRLTRDDRVGFEVSADLPPYRGVRGTGHARIDPAAAADVLPQLVARYQGDTDTTLGRWLLSRLDTEVAIHLTGLHVASWDYTPRMGTPEA